MAKELTYLDIMTDLRNGLYKPVYYLMGEEDYFIDLIADFIEENVLSETEKGFNQTVMYGADVDIATIINSAKRYPMMSDYQVIIVREAQNVKNMEELVYYIQKPLKSTILVLCHKHGTLDKRKKLAAEIQKVGVLYESKRLKDYQLPDFITSYLRQQKIDIEPKAASMMADFVGTDLSRMVGELEKLIITLPKDQRSITPLQIEQNIGISKDYNNFELRNAIIQKNVEKANRIIKHFAENPKTNPIQLTLIVLFNFFSNLMLAYYAPVKSDEGVAAQLGLRSSWQAKEYVTAMRAYSGVKVMQIISDIRTYDARSKGVDNSSVTDAELLKELVYRILH